MQMEDNYEKNRKTVAFNRKIKNNKKITKF